MAHRLIFGLLLTTALSGCFGGGNDTAAGTANTASAANAAGAANTVSASNVVTGSITSPNTTSPPAVSAAPSISGTPAAAVTAGLPYSFLPAASDDAGNVLTFSITNCPAWASFSTSTGELSGTPTTAEAGVYSNIVIAVNDGAASAALPAFSVTVTAPAGGTPVSPPTIGGTPATAVLAGAAYVFTPTTGSGNAALAFSVTNLPSWATFNSSTGELSGTPTSADVGNFPNIVISVSDDSGHASLPPFSIAVTQSASGSATLSWTPPTENTDGTPVTNLSGYRIYYGTSAAAITESIQVANVGIATYVVNNLSPGTWYFEVRAYNAANMESSPSAVASKMIN